MSGTDLGQMTLPGLPPLMGALGAVSGIRVIESPLLRYDKMFIAQEQQAIVVGEVAHFRYRIDQLNRNKKLREQVRADIRASARRILGEPWKLSSD